MRLLLLLFCSLAVTACSKPEQTKTPGATSQSNAVALAPASAPQTSTTPMAVDKTATRLPTRRGSSETHMIVDLPSDVLFAYDSAKLAPNADMSLSRTAQIIAAAPPGPIAITGYTDGRGEDDYNLDLSQKRAKAVAEWLEAHGVDAKRITTQGRGKADPVAPNTKLDGSDDPRGRARNRRVEIEIPRAG